MQRRTGSVDVEHFLDAWFRVRQMIQAANFNRFQSAGLSATQFMTLNLLPEDGSGIAMGELARRMNLAASTVAKTVDSLETRRLVARVRSTEDGRLVLLRATAQGRRLQNAAAGQFREQISRMFDAMSADERRGLIEGLEALLRVNSAGNGKVADTAAHERLRGSSERAALPARREQSR